MSSEGDSESPWSKDKAKKFEKYAHLACRPDPRLSLYVWCSPSNCLPASLTASTMIPVRTRPRAVSNASRGMRAIKKCARISSSKRELVVPLRALLCRLEARLIPPGANILSRAYRDCKKEWVCHHLSFKYPFTIEAIVLTPRFQIEQRRANSKGWFG